MPRSDISPYNHLTTCRIQRDSVSFQFQARQQQVLGLPPPPLLGHPPAQACCPQRTAGTRVTRSSSPAARAQQQPRHGVGFSAAAVLLGYGHITAALYTSSARDACLTSTRDACFASARAISITGTRDAYIIGANISNVIHAASFAGPFTTSGPSRSPASQHGDQVVPRDCTTARDDEPLR